MMVMTGSGPLAEESFFVLCKQQKEANNETFKHVLDELRDYKLKGIDFSALKTDYLYSHQNFRALENFIGNLSKSPRDTFNAVDFFDSYPSPYERREYIRTLTERSMRTVIYNVAAFTSIDEFKEWMNSSNGIDPQRVQVTPEEDKPFFYKVNLLIGFNERRFNCVGGPYEKVLSLDLDGYFLMETSSQFHSKSRELYSLLQSEHQLREQAERELRKQEQDELDRKAAERKAKRAAKGSVTNKERKE